MNNEWIDRDLNHVEATIHGADLTQDDLQETRRRLESLLRVVNENLEKDRPRDVL